jgi:predicted RNase H-like nuclease
VNRSREEVMGVDACPTGWAGVVLHGGRYHGAYAARDLGGLLDRAPGAAIVGIDIPLGLPAARWRQADLLAATRLGAHRSRVFPVPPRPVWEEEDYLAANHRCRLLTGSGLSRQTWGLVKKLREANQHRDAGDDRLYEVHPEVSFAAMAGGPPVAWRKKSWNGQSARRRLLRSQGIALPDTLDDAGGVPPDDLLDAAAAAWTAHRIAQQAAEALPDPPEHTESGLPIAIWC